MNRIQAFLKISDRQKLRPGAPASPRQLRFRQILRRQNDPPNPRFFHSQNHGQHAFHAAHVPLKGYLSNKTNFTKGIGVRVSHGAQNSHGNGQIQMAPILRMPAGIKFTVTRRRGYSKPEFRRPDLMRSRDSITVVDANPTMLT